MAVINRTPLKYPNYKIPKPSKREYSSYYNNRIWKQERDLYIEKQPLCEICLQHGVIKEAEHVHHIVPFSRGTSKEKRIRLLTNPDNFMSTCKTCHKWLHKTDYDDTKPLDYLSDKDYEEAHGLKWLK